jgi:hypothetical protein
MVGMERSDATRAKISVSLQGKVGDRSRRWKGDDAGYSAIHMWLRQHIEKSGVCQHCKKKTKKTEFANISGKYRRSISDYLELCHSCHTLYDNKKRAIRKKVA